MKTNMRQRLEVRHVTATDTAALEKCSETSRKALKDKRYSSNEEQDCESGPSFDFQQKVYARVKVDSFIAYHLASGCQPSVH